MHFAREISYRTVRTFSAAHTAACTSPTSRKLCKTYAQMDGEGYCRLSTKFKHPLFGQGAPGRS